MPNTFYYLRGAFSEQNLVATYGNIITDAINNLLQGHYTQKNLEKLTGHAVYSLRLGAAARLLFTTRQIGEAKYLLVLDYLPNHEYHKSRFLRSGVLRNYLQREVSEQPLFTDVSSDTINSILNGIQAVAGDTTNGIALDYYKQQLIELTAHQQAALQVPLPAVISGVAGSGKSCIALSLLSSYVSTPNDSGESRRIMYVSQSDALVASMRDAWSHLLAAVDTGDIIEFITYADLVRQQLDASAPPLVDRLAFEAWYERLLKQKGTPADYRALSKDQVYEEFRICSGFNEQSYYELGRRQSLVTDSLRPTVYALYQAYREFQTTNGIDPAFYPFSAQQVFDLVVVDEAQDFSHLSNQNLRRLSKQNSIVYCMDSHQQLHDRRSVRPYLLQSLGVDDSHHVRLDTTYRCPLQVVAVANEVIALKHRLVGGIADKHEVTEIASVGENQVIGEVHVRTQAELEASDWIRVEKGANFAVVTEARYREQAKHLFKTELVLTPEEIKGLEYETVVTYKLCDTENFKPMKKRLAALGEKQPTNRPKNDAAQEEFAPVLNRIYTSFMRAQQTLVICEQSSRENEFLLNKIKHLAHIRPLSAENLNQRTTREDWSIELHRQLAVGNHALARHIFLQHQFGDELAFAALLSGPSQPPAKTEVGKANTAPEILTTSSVITNVPHKSKNKLAKVPPVTLVAAAVSPPSREALSVQRLFNQFDEKVLKISLEIFDIETLLLKSYDNGQGAQQTLLQFIQHDLQRTQLFFKIIVNNLKILEKIAQATPKLTIECRGRHREQFEKNLQILNSFRIKLTLSGYLPRLLNSGCKPLQLVMSKKNSEFVFQLIKLGADVNTKELDSNNTIAHFAAENRDIPTIRLLHAQGADLNMKNSFGYTPAIIAGQNNDVDMIKALHACGADLNIGSDDGFNPAHNASELGYVNLLYTLNACGADLNRYSHTGCTPAHFAAINNRVDSLQTLHACGADINKSLDEHVFRPIDLAIFYGQLSVVQYLSTVIDANEHLCISSKALKDEIKQMHLPNYNQDIVKRLQETIDKKVDEDGFSHELISLSLLDIALIMNHGGIVNYLTSIKKPSDLITNSLFASNTPSQADSGKLASLSLGKD